MFNNRLTTSQWVSARGVAICLKIGENVKLLKG